MQPIKRFSTGDYTHHRNGMEPLRPGQAQRSALSNRTVADAPFGSEPTRMYQEPF
jgi:hypothetical protein